MTQDGNELANMFQRLEAKGHCAVVMCSIVVMIMSIEEMFTINIPLYIAILYLIMHRMTTSTCSEFDSMISSLTEKLSQEVSILKPPLSTLIMLLYFRPHRKLIQ